MNAAEAYHLLGAKPGETKPSIKAWYHCPILVDTVNAAYYRFGEKAGNAFRDGLKLKE